jgi:hypothetical protein
MVLNIFKDEMIRILCEMTYNFDPDKWYEFEMASKYKEA